MSVEPHNSATALTIGEVVIFLIVIIVAIAILPPAISLVRKRLGQYEDVSNAKSIGRALRQFAVDHKGAFPNKEPASDYAVEDDLTPANKSNETPANLILPPE